MANANVPFGALLLDAEGKQFHGRRFVKKSGNAIYSGDFVSQDATGTVDVAVANGVMLGVALEYAAATSTAEILVCDDPAAVYEIQVDGDITQAAVFANADIVATTGDTALLHSKHVLQSSSINTTNTLPLKILGLSKVASNAFGSYAKVKVKINKHAYSSGILGV
jgi:hypothetical protein